MLEANLFCNAADRKLVIRVRKAESQPDTRRFEDMAYEWARTTATERYPLAYTFSRSARTAPSSSL